MAHQETVQRIHDALNVLHTCAPSYASHLKAYRCNAEWRQVRATIKFRGPQGRMIESPGWKRERIVPSWINMRKVADAENWLVRAVPGQIVIPRELWDGLTKPAKTA